MLSEEFLVEYTEIPWKRETCYVRLRRNDCDSGIPNLSRYEGIYTAPVTIEIVIYNTHFFIPIEVKIYAGEQKGQFYDYFSMQNILKF